RPEFALEGIERIEVGTFAVTGTEDDGFADFVQKSLRERLTQQWAGKDQRKQPGEPTNKIIHVGGDILIETRDTGGTRTVRRWSSGPNQMETQDVETLVRTAKVNVDFVVGSGEGREPIVTVETHRSYNSANDPRVRGELGLDRSDDPGRVPPTEAIVTRLLDECVEEFCGMIVPFEVTQRIPLRWTLGAKGAAAFKAVEAGDFETAVRDFEAASAEAPDDVNLRFNLAAAAEAAGNLTLALAQYEEVAKRTNGRDLA
ncbi:unnamed protein product, partial [marine sediment metagenome]